MSILKANAMFLRDKADEANPVVENEQTETKPETGMNAKEFLQALEQQKKNSVPKEDYEKLAQDNKELMNAILDGKQFASDNQVEEKVDIQKLRNEMFTTDNNMDNITYVKNALKLRAAVMEKEGYDIFTPHGTKITPDHNDIESAEKVANVLQECIDESEGDNTVFTALLQSRTNDVRFSRKK